MTKNARKLTFLLKSRKNAKKMPIFSTLKSISEDLARHMTILMLPFATELNSLHFKKKSLKICKFLRKLWKIRISSQNSKKFCDF